MVFLGFYHFSALLKGLENILFLHQEIVDKINRLKTATGNTDINFSNVDIDGDFDPDDYDKKMNVSKLPVNISFLLASVIQRTNLR